MMKGRSLFVLFVFLLIGTGAFAQKGKKMPPDQPLPQLDSLRKYEKELKVIGDSMIDGRFQAARINAVLKFIPLLVKTLKFDGSFDYPFDSLPYIKKLMPEDRKFKIYNWTLKYDDGSYRYYSALQINDPKGFKLIPLRDFREKMDTNFEQVVVGPSEWIGAQYYSIFTTEIKKQKYYMLLGWDGSQYISDKKIIEAMWFDEKGIPQFGAPIFDVKGKTKNRVIFEFSGNATMLLQYIPDHNIIAFDHLVPPNDAGEGFYYTYVPDGTYDYFIFKKGKWMWSEELFKNFKKPIKEAGE